MLFVAAFITGLISSFHCVVMCGPLAFALPARRTSNALFILDKLIYNFGRVFTYALLGLAFGLFGFGLKLAGLQQIFSIAAGILIILSVLFSFKNKTTYNAFSFLNKNIIAKLINNKKPLSLFFIGTLNGLLPCGFVYLALVGASVTQSIWHGAIYMVLFGLGTMPFMLVISVFGQFLSIKVRGQLVKLMPYFALIIAGLFILRGLNLGIPYVSPQINNNTVNTEICK